MAEFPDFNLKETDQRTIVRLRVRPDGADAAAKAMQLPQQALQSLDGNPTIHWLGPDQWLLTSENESVADILAHIDSALSGQLFGATDMSSGLTCFSLSGQRSRTLLAMGCGIDMHPDSFSTGQCIRTRFAQVPVFMVATKEFEFDLYVDRSYAQYLHEWLTAASKDPIIYPC
jgi:sarcosine oxidase subunit gamma